MVNTAQMLDDSTTIKQNFIGNEDEESNDLVVREKFRVWNKLTRVYKDGVEQAVIVPFDTYLEPFYNTEDVDLTIDNCAVYNSANEQFKFYTDANGNYKYLLSQPICYRQTHSLESIMCTVYCVDDNGDDASEHIQVEIYNGQDWIAMNNNSKIYMYDYFGTDLDATLDFDLTDKYSNLDDDGNIVFENYIKYKITRITDQPVYVTRLVIKFTWNF